jgi:hypothetical protein
MWSLVLLLVCVAVVVAFAIYKISRENTQASSSAYTPASAIGPPSVGDNPSDSPHFEMIRSIFQHQDLFSGADGPTELHADKMIATSTIVSGVEHFKANYRGPKREQIITVLDEALAELKSRFPGQISAHDLREFIKAKRQSLLPREN